MKNHLNANQKIFLQTGYTFSLSHHSQGYSTGSNFWIKITSENGIFALEGYLKVHARCGAKFQEDRLFQQANRCDSFFVPGIHKERGRINRRPRVFLFSTTIKRGRSRAIFSPFMGDASTEEQREKVGYTYIPRRDFRRYLCMYVSVRVRVCFPYIIVSFKVIFLCVSMALKFNFRRLAR